jgi:hypothetical protein
MSKELTGTYELEFHINFSSPGNPHCGISDEKLGRCDLFLYHPMKNIAHNEGTDKLLTLLPDRCIAFPLPYVTFGAYWPDFGCVPSNPLGVSEDCAYGRIPYRSAVLDKLISEEHSAENILKRYIENYSQSLGSPQTVIQSDFAYLDKLDKRPGPFFIRQYIEDNHRSRQLFYFFNHPKKEIYLHLANQLLNYLGFSPLSYEEVKDAHGHAEQNLPIHPKTAQLLQLEFVQKDTMYSYLNNHYTFEDFIKYYIELSLG